MNIIEKRINDLYQYRPDLTKEADLEDFWERILDEVHQKPMLATRVTQDTLLQDIAVYDIEFNGYKETPMHGLFMKPIRTIYKQPQEKFPCVIIFPGYQAVRLGAEQYTEWLSMGIAVFAVSIRGQSAGNTLGSSHGMVKGWMTENILNIEESYYKALAVDNLRAVRWTLEQEDIDTKRVAVIGGSQGGGLSLLAAEFFPQLCAAVADIPNLCHLDYGVFHSQGSLTEIAEFCRKFTTNWQDVLKSLSYFDHLNLAERIKLPIMLSVGLKDLICMPETIFPVYHQISSEKKCLEIYPFTGHAVEIEQRKKGYEFIYNHLFGN